MNDWRNAVVFTEFGDDHLKRTLSVVAVISLVTDRIPLQMTLDGASAEIIEVPIELGEYLLGSLFIEQEPHLVVTTEWCEGASAQR